MFRKLFNFISGENTNKQKIEMTSPVRVDYKSTNGNDNINSSNSECRMQMGFLIPRKFHDNLPFPIGENMGIKNEPEMIIAAITYNGVSTLESSLNYKNILIESIGDDAKLFDCKNFITAGYNAPFDPVQTHEVWLRKI
jgi:hypothetical protein